MRKRVSEKGKEEEEEEEHEMNGHRKRFSRVSETGVLKDQKKEGTR